MMERERLFYESDAEGWCRKELTPVEQKHEGVLPG